MPIIRTITLPMSLLWSPDGQSSELIDPALWKPRPRDGLQPLYDLYDPTKPPATPPKKAYYVAPSRIVTPPPPNTPKPVTYVWSYDPVSGLESYGPTIPAGWVAGKAPTPPPPNPTSLGGETNTTGGLTSTLPISKPPIPVVLPPAIVLTPRLSNGIAADPSTYPTALDVRWATNFRLNPMTIEPYLTYNPEGMTEVEVQSFSLSYYRGANYYLGWAQIFNKRERGVTTNYPADQGRFQFTPTWEGSHLEFPTNEFGSPRFAFGGTTDTNAFEYTFDVSTGHTYGGINQTQIYSLNGMRAVVAVNTSTYSGACTVRNVDEATRRLEYYTPTTGGGAEFFSGNAVYYFPESYIQIEHELGIIKLDLGSPFGTTGRACHIVDLANPVNHWNLDGTPMAKELAYLTATPHLARLKVFIFEWNKVTTNSTTGKRDYSNAGLTTQIIEYNTIGSKIIFHNCGDFGRCNITYVKKSLPIPNVYSVLSDTYLPSPTTATLKSLWDARGEIKTWLGEYNAPISALSKKFYFYIWSTSPVSVEPNDNPTYDIRNVFIHNSFTGWFPATKISGYATPILATNEIRVFEVDLPASYFAGAKLNFATVNEAAFRIVFTKSSALPPAEIDPNAPWPASDLTPIYPDTHATEGVYARYNEMVNFRVSRGWTPYVSLDSFNTPTLFSLRPRLDDGLTSVSIGVVPYSEVRYAMESLLPTGVFSPLTANAISIATTSAVGVTRKIRIRSNDPLGTLTITSMVFTRPVISGLTVALTTAIAGDYAITGVSPSFSITNTPVGATTTTISSVIPLDVPFEFNVVFKPKVKTANSLQNIRKLTIDIYGTYSFDTTATPFLVKTVTIAGTAL